MDSLKKLKMKKVRGVLSSKEEVSRVRTTLETKAAHAFGEFAKSKQKVRALVHLKCLD